MVYTYAKDGNRDRLASVDGKKIEYVDGSRGTPNNYCGNATEFGTFNRLSKYKGLTFNYSASGERLSKTHEEGESKFHYAGGKLIAEERTITDDAFKIYPQINGASGTDINNSYFYASSAGESYSYSSRALRVTLEYIYGANGLTGFSVTHPILNGTEKQTYFYRRNLQGDVTHIFDEAGILKAKYAYDAWGNCKIIYSQDGIATLNPIRYRGYYFDNETGLFYTPGRYYDPEVGRWINADDVAYLDPETIGGLNLYAYCGNDPINRVDPTGNAWYEFWKWDWNAIGAGALMVLGAAAAIAISVATFGAGTPLGIAIVAGVTLGAGVLMGINGIATIGEGITNGYNFMRDGLFNEVLGLSDDAYNIYSGVVGTVAAIGTAVLGVYGLTGRAQAARAGRNFLGKGYSKAGSGRWLSKDGFRQMRIDNHNPFGKHFNLETWKYPVGSGMRNRYISNIHQLYKWFKTWIG